jgi:hypothetical protein
MKGKIKLKKLLSFKVVVFLLSFLVIFVLILLNVSVATPNSWPFYDFKRLYEKTRLTLISSPEDKLNYQYSLLDKRLAELTFIVENKASSQILNTSLRYSTTAGQTVEIVIDNNMTDKLEKTKQKLEGHLLIVKNLIQKYPSDDSEAKFIIDDANYLQIYINKLSSR